MLNRFGIQTRLLAGFGVILAAGAACFAAAAHLGRQAEQQAALAAEEAQHRVDAAVSMITAQLTAAVSVRDAALMSNGNSRMVKAELENYKKAMASLRLQEDTLVRQGLDPGSKALLDDATKMRMQAEPVVQEAMDLVLNLAGEEGAKLMQSKLAPVQSKWAETLQRLAANERRLGQARIESIRHANAARSLALGLALAVVTVLGIVFAIHVTRSVTLPLRRAAAVAEQIAGGDLTIELDVQGFDEAASMLRALQTMSSQLKQMVGSIREASSSLSYAASEIGSGNMDLSARTENQAASLEQTSMMLSDIADAVGDNSRAAKSAHLLAERTASSAEQAGTMVAEVMGTMSRINASSKRISEIIGVIDGIAFQTNILALNAAAEAARASDQGRGFGAVAEEVRRLSASVASAAREVRQLISESVTQVQDGSSQVEGMSRYMQDLVARSREVSSLVTQISSASDLQSSNITSADANLRQIDANTQQNAALVEQVAAASQSLVSQIQTLNHLIGQFRTV